MKSLGSLNLKIMKKANESHKQTRPLKIIVSVEKDTITVITNYPLKNVTIGKKNRENTLSSVVFANFMNNPGYVKPISFLNSFNDCFSISSCRLLP